MAWGVAKLTNPLDKRIQNSRVPPVPDILSNHGLVKPGIVHQETGHLFCEFGGRSHRDDSPLLKEGDALFWLNVELLGGCKYHLKENRGRDETTHVYIHESVSVHYDVSIHVHRVREV